jgi:hypothetical protein
MKNKKSPTRREKENWRRMRTLGIICGLGCNLQAGPVARGEAARDPTGSLDFVEPITLLRTHLSLFSLFYALYGIILSKAEKPCNSRPYLMKQFRIELLTDKLKFPSRWAFRDPTEPAFPYA